MLKGLLNRRVSKRVAFKNEMSLLLESNGRAMALATATNVSSGGIQFYVPEGLLDIQPGEELELIFHLPEIGEVNIRCEIRYLNHGKDRDEQNIVYYGGKFLDITVDTLKGLQVFCEDAILEEKPVESAHQTNPAPQSDPKNLACYLKENPDPKKMLTQESIDRLVAFLLDSEAEVAEEPKSPIQNAPVNVVQPQAIETPAHPEAPDASVETPDVPDAEPTMSHNAASEVAPIEQQQPKQVETAESTFPEKPGRPRLQDLFGLFGEGPTISNSTITSLFNDRFAEDTNPDGTSPLPPLNYIADLEVPETASQSDATPAATEATPSIPGEALPEEPQNTANLEFSPESGQNVSHDSASGYVAISDDTREVADVTPTPLAPTHDPLATVDLGDLELPIPPSSVIPSLHDDAGADSEVPGTIANRSRFQNFFNIFHNNGTEKVDPTTTTDHTSESSYPNNESPLQTTGSEIAPAASETEQRSANEVPVNSLGQPSDIALDSIDTTPVNTLFNTLSQTAAKTEAIPAPNETRSNSFADFGGFESPYQKLVDQLVNSMVPEPTPANPMKNEPPPIRPSINSVGFNPLPATTPEAASSKEGPLNIAATVPLPVTEEISQPVPQAETIQSVTKQPDPVRNDVPKIAAPTNPLGTPLPAPKPVQQVVAKNLPFNSDLQHPELAGNDTVFNSDQSSIDMLVSMLLHNNNANTGANQATPAHPGRSQAVSEGTLSANPKNKTELSTSKSVAPSETQADERPALPPLFQSSAAPGGLPANNSYLDFLHSMPETAPEVTEAAPVQEPELPSDCSHIQLKEGHSIPVSIEDLNIGGITVRLSESVPEGTNVLVNLAIEGFNVHNIIANCEWIGRSQNNQFLAGFIFRQLTPEQTSLLRNMIQRFTS